MCWCPCYLICTVPIYKEIKCDIKEEQGITLSVISFLIQFKNIDCQWKILFWLLFFFSYSLSNWELDCGGGDVSPCADPTGTELFPVTSSVTFIDIPINTGPPKSRCFLILRQIRWWWPSDRFFFRLKSGTLSPRQGFKSTSQSMTVTGTMCVGLSWPFLSPGITQVRIQSVLDGYKCFSHINVRCKICP